MPKGSMGKIGTAAGEGSHISEGPLTLVNYDQIFEPRPIDPQIVDKLTKTRKMKT